MKRPNPLSPALMTPMERRRELCGLLALGLVRLYQRNRAALSSELSAIREKGSLDCPAGQSGHATPTQEEAA